MQFAAPAEHYDRFMGRYLPTLAVELVCAAGVTPGMRVVDVGCGPGGLTRELASCVGADHVAGIDPAAQFVAACRSRNPGADVREGIAEQLPWPDARFDAALSSLAIAFMGDPDRAIREMARVCRPGGTVTVCMWDLASGGMTMLRVFWEAAHSVDPAVVVDRGMAGTSRGDIAGRFRAAGLQDVLDGSLTAHAQYDSFEDFWEPFELGVGPAGAYLATLGGQQRSEVRDACRGQVPSGSFALEARAWYARGVIGS
jgi:SAM-dependent methyltransferase